MSKGGFVAFRGSAAVAVDYLAGTLNVADATQSSMYLSPDELRPFQFGAVTADGAAVGTMSRDEFCEWATHKDPETGEQRGGQLRVKTTTKMNDDGTVEHKTGGTPLYQETTVSSSKSLSLAAASDPKLAEALEAAMERATIDMAKVIQEHAVTRVGPLGAQRQVKFDQIEFTAVQHETSRTGDPHMHRHVQFLTKGLVTLPNGKQTWRAIDGAVLYRLAELAHARADISLSTDAELRQAIADAGYTWQPGEGGGKIAEFEPLTNEFSQRRDQISEARESLEAQWRAEHPGQTPTAKQIRTWDNYGWSQTRPDKKELEQDEQEDQADRLATVVPANTAHEVKTPEGEISAEQIGADAVSRLSQKRSAWATADLKATIDRRLAETYLLDKDKLADLQKDAFKAAQSELVNLYDQGVDIEGTQHWTSKTVLKTDRAIEESLKSRAQAAGHDGNVEIDRGKFQLTEGQAAAARSITGSHQLVVVEGAAGTGKTTMLEAAKDQIVKEDRRIVAVSPTKRGALEMAKEVGVEGNSVHGMLVAAGASFDDCGRWTLPKQWKKQRAGLDMDQKTVLVVDEVGMLDMGTAEVLHKYCDDTKVQLVLLGDRKQLAAAGRGGYLPKAVHLATQSHDLKDVQRFKTAGKKIDQEYADATLDLRDQKDPEKFFDLLVERGQVQTGEPDEVIGRVAETVALEIGANKSSIAIASTNVTAQKVNHAVYERLVATGKIDDAVLYARLVAEGETSDPVLFRKLSKLKATGAGDEQRAKLEELIADGTIRPSKVVEGRGEDPIAVGAKVATRQNDRETQVANRQTWIVQKINDDGRVIVKDEETGFRTTLEPEYVQENLQLAYAVTAHGSQGMTVDTAHTIISNQMDAAGVYVGLTRGRYANVLHAVGVDQDDAREQFTDAVARASADQGLDAAKSKAQDSLQGLALQTPQQRAHEILFGTDQPEISDSYRDRFSRLMAEFGDEDALVLRDAVADEELDHRTQVEIFMGSRTLDTAQMRTDFDLSTREADTLKGLWIDKGLPEAGNEKLAREQIEALSSDEFAELIRVRPDIGLGRSLDTSHLKYSQRYSDIQIAAVSQRWIDDDQPLDTAELARANKRRMQAAAQPVVEVAKPEVATGSKPAEPTKQVEAKQPERYRSGLRDLPGNHAQLASFDEKWHNRMPANSDERRLFERQASPLGVQRTVLEDAQVRQAMGSDVLQVLLERLDQFDSANAGIQRWKAQEAERKALVEFQRTKDKFGIHGTRSKIEQTKANKAFEKGYIDRLAADRKTGVYGTREREVLDHYGDEHAVQRAAQSQSAEQAKSEPTETQTRIRQQIEDFEQEQRERDLLQNEEQSSGYSLGE